MKTEELVNMLATGLEATKVRPLSNRYATALTMGSGVAVLLMLSLLHIRSDLTQAVLLPMFWLKLGFVASLVVVSLFAAMRLSRPGARVKVLPVAVAAPFLLMWAIAAWMLIAADPEQRMRMFLGDTWKVCPFLIAMLSTPIFAGVMWAMKGLAPTRPRMAGAVAGLLAGATAALVYCLHCPEIEAPFIAFWYVLGMLIPVGAGALLGGVLLRW